jgi:hypothetical protein
MFAVSMITDGTPIAGVSNMTNVQVLDPDDLEEDIAMLELVGAMEQSDVKTEVEGLVNDVGKLVGALDQLNLSDCSFFSIGTVQAARGAVQQARYSIRDVYAPCERFSSQRSQGG